ncbi:MAG: nucleoside phosphorylase [Tenacibaculum sp.]
MNLQHSELILNSDGSIYHLNLKPEHISTDIIFVGDQDRVDKVTKYFSNIEYSTQKREFKTTTGFYKGKRLTVISTGIGPDNIDIVLNELDALVNIDLETRQINKKHTTLNITRIGTSGSLQTSLPTDSFLLSTHAIDLNGLLHFYQTDSIATPEIEKAFVRHMNWSIKKSYPLVVKSGNNLEKKLDSALVYKGITATSGGFYGPQGRVLRLGLADPNMNKKMNSFAFNRNKITNLEMETSAIYGLSKLMGHNAISINAIIANRANGTFSSHPSQTVDNLIRYTLNKLVD